MVLARQVVATRKILLGAELTVEYGKKYWKNQKKKNGYASSNSPNSAKRAYGLWSARTDVAAIAALLPCVSFSLADPAKRQKTLNGGKHIAGKAPQESIPESPHPPLAAPVEARGTRNRFTGSYKCSWIAWKASLRRLRRCALPSLWTVVAENLRFSQLSR